MIELDTLIHGDSIEILKTFPENFIHAIISDIPYGIGCDDWDILHSHKFSIRGTLARSDFRRRTLQAKGKTAKWLERVRQEHTARVSVMVRIMGRFMAQSPEARRYMLHFCGKALRSQVHCSS